MSSHTLFYYPYASFTNEQLPLLKVAALWFDKLVILDPVDASWDTIGADHVARDAVRLLEDARILEIVTPATVLARYERPIAEAIRRDMSDAEFLSLCDAHSLATGKHRWTLSLAKVPQDLQADQAMRHLLGDFAREVSWDSAQFRERAGANSSEYHEYAETGQVYDEYREGYDTDVEYRYADLPLALGEAIMMNHALFAGLLHAEATPITDEPFHSRALALKLARAEQEPAIREIRSDVARMRRIKPEILAATALTDFELELPALDPAIPLEAVLEYREANADALGEARAKLGRMARRIRAEPWSDDFAREIESDTIPDIVDELEDARKARDAWLKRHRKRLGLTGAGIAAGAVAAGLAVFTAPLTPVALAAAGLGLASGAVIPGTEWMLDWRDGRSSAQENGIHYLLRL